MGRLNQLKTGFKIIIDEINLYASIKMDLFNHRVKLLDYKGDIEFIQHILKELCAEHHLSKIICMVKESERECLLSNGFVEEGKIDGFFKGTTGFWLSCFTDPARAISQKRELEDEIIAHAVQSKNTFIPEPDSCFIRTADESDSETVASVFDTVFKTYPTPMSDPAFIRKMMAVDVLFKVAVLDNNIVSIGSADMDRANANAEITDCATLPDYRGRGLLSQLIYHLELELAEKQFISLYSLSRAPSYGINVVLSKHGYRYTGRLVNNCDIMGGFEDMNVWCKVLNP